jgi:hypothetical protein
LNQFLLGAVSVRKGLIGGQDAVFRIENAELDVFVPEKYS